MCFLDLLKKEKTASGLGYTAKNSCFQQRKLTNIKGKNFIDTINNDSWCDECVVASQNELLGPTIQLPRL